MDDELDQEGQRGVEKIDIRSGRTQSPDVVDGSRESELTDVPEIQLDPD